jgi:hypothetical protein
MSPLSRQLPPCSHNPAFTISTPIMPMRSSTLKPGWPWNTRPSPLILLPRPRRSGRLPMNLAASHRVLAHITGTDTIFFIPFARVPTDRTVTYGRLVCDYRPQKAEAERTRLTVGGNLISYPYASVLTRLTSPPPSLSSTAPSPHQGLANSSSMSKTTTWVHHWKFTSICDLP